MCVCVCVCVCLSVFGVVCNVVCCCQEIALLYIKVCNRCRPNKCISWDSVLVMM